MPGVVIDVTENHNCDIKLDTDLGECTDDDKWGFKITGGVTFGMPITIFYVRSLNLYKLH